MRKRRFLGLLIAPLLLLATACGGNDNSLESQDSPSAGGGGGAKGSVVIGGQDFTESQILTEIYTKLLNDYYGRPSTMRRLDYRIIVLAISLLG